MIVVLCIQSFSSYCHCVIVSQEADGMVLVGSTGTPDQVTSANYEVELDLKCPSSSSSSLLSVKRASAEITDDEESDDTPRATKKHKQSSSASANLHRMSDFFNWCEAAFGGNIIVFVYSNYSCGIILLHLYGCFVDMTADQMDVEKIPLIPSRKWSYIILIYMY
jgi:hypothetical protein